MAESQSRFSIIEELTNRKLGIDNEINTLESAIENVKAGLLRELEDNARAVARRKEDVVRENEQRTTRIKMLRLQKVELEKGIKAIQTVSKENKKA